MSATLAKELPTSRVAAAQELATALRATALETSAWVTPARIHQAAIAEHITAMQALRLQPSPIAEMARLQSMPSEFAKAMEGQKNALRVMAPAVQSIAMAKQLMASSGIMAQSAVAAEMARITALHSENYAMTALSDRMRELAVVHSAHAPALSLAKELRDRLAVSSVTSELMERSKTMVAAAEQIRATMAAGMHLGQLSRNDQIAGIAASMTQAMEPSLRAATVISPWLQSVTNAQKLMALPESLLSVQRLGASVLPQMLAANSGIHALTERLYAEREHWHKLALQASRVTERPLTIRFGAFLGKLDDRIADLDALIAELEFMTLSISAPQDLAQAVAELRWDSLDAAEFLDLLFAIDDDEVSMISPQCLQAWYDAKVLCKKVGVLEKRGRHVFSLLCS